MSSWAFRKAVETTLRQNLGLANSQCSLMYSGKPAIGATPPVFVAIHEAAWINTAGDIDWIYEGFDINITVSVNASTVPINLWGGITTSDRDAALDFYCRHIIDQVHGNYTIMQAANKLITVATGLTGKNWTFDRPLKFSRAGNPEPKGSAWWGAPATTQPDLVGVAQQLSFVEAKRARQAIALEGEEE